MRREPCHHCFTQLITRLRTNYLHPVEGLAPPTTRDQAREMIIAAYLDFADCRPRAPADAPLSDRERSRGITLLSRVASYLVDFTKAEPTTPSPGTPDA